MRRTRTSPHAVFPIELGQSWEVAAAELRILFLVFILIGCLGLPASVVAQDAKDSQQNSQQQSEEEAEEQKRAEQDDQPKFDFFDDKIPQSIEQLREMEQHFRELAEKVSDATVNIQVGRSQGSGVIVSRDGYIMTAAHVIGGANRDAWVQLRDGTRLKAKTLGLNRTIDSGLAKIVDSGPYEYLELGVSESLKPGQWVMALGHPGGWDEDRGMVYRVGRILRQDERTIATDCTLVGGDSGGPLVDMDGAVIGIHSRIGAFLTNNFHVPVDTYSETWDDLANARDWGRGIGGRNRANEPWMGLSFNDSSLEIRSVVPDGPADKAGLKAGDTLLEFDGKKLVSRFSLASLYRRTKPNQKVKLKIQRGDETIEAEMTIGSQKDNPNN